MAEVFGVATGALQVAQAGLALSKTLHDYVDAVRNANNFIKAIALEVRLTASTLENLGTLLKDHEAEKICSPAVLSDAQAAFDGCREAFNEADESFRTLVKIGQDGKTTVSASRRWSLPFKKGRLETLQSNLERLKSTLMLMLSVLSYARERAKSTTEHQMRLDSEKLRIRELMKGDEADARHEQILAAFSRFDTASKPSTFNATRNLAEISTFALPVRATIEEPSDDTERLLSHLDACASAVSGLARVLESVRLDWRTRGHYEPSSIVSSYARLSKFVQRLPKSSVSRDGSSARLEGGRHAELAHAYSYMTSADIYRDTAPIRHGTRQRQDDIDRRMTASRERPIGTTDDYYDPGVSSEHVVPAPVTKGWDNITDEEKWKPQGRIEDDNDSMIGPRPKSDSHQPRMAELRGDMARIIDNSASDKRENRVRIVDPPTEDEQRRPRNILQKPRREFPDSRFNTRQSMSNQPREMAESTIDAEEDYRRRIEQVQRELGLPLDHRHNSDSDSDRKRRHKERKARKEEERRRGHEPQLRRERGPDRGLGFAFELGPTATKGYFPISDENPGRLRGLVLVASSINKDASATDENGTTVEPVVEADSKATLGRTGDGQGDISDHTRRIIGRCDAVNNSESIENHNGQTPGFEGLAVSKDGNVPTPAGNIIGCAVQGDSNALCDHILDKDESIIDKSGSTVGRAQRWSPEEKQPVVNPMQGMCVDEEGGVRDQHSGHLIGRLTRGNLGQCINQKIDGNGIVVDQDGNKVGEYSLLEDIDERDYEGPSEEALAQAAKHEEQRETAAKTAKQLMLLEQQNKKRLLKARQDRDSTGDSEAEDDVGGTMPAYEEELAEAAKIHELVTSPMATGLAEGTEDVGADHTPTEEHAAAEDSGAIVLDMPRNSADLEIDSQGYAIIQSSNFFCFGDTSGGGSMEDDTFPGLDMGNYGDDYVCFEAEENVGRPTAAYEAVDELLRHWTTIEV